MSKANSKQNSLEEARSLLEWRWRPPWHSLGASVSCQPPPVPGRGRQSSVSSPASCVQPGLPWGWGSHRDCSEDEKLHLQTSDRRDRTSSVVSTGLHSVRYQPDLLTSPPVQDKHRTAPQTWRKSWWRLKQHFPSHCNDNRLSTLSMSQATMTMMIQDYDGLTNQLLATLQDPEFNDVKIETLDGDVVEVNCLKSLDDCSKMGLHSVGQTLLTYRGPQPARPAESSNKRYKRWAMRILMDYDFMSILRQLNVINNIFSSGLNFSLFYYQ